MHALAAILSLLIGAAGWFYLFYANPGAGLESIEARMRSRLRARLRRIGGLAMIGLAVLFYIAFRFTPIDGETRPPWSVGLAWLGVIVLLGIVLLLGLIDVILTGRLRRDILRRKQP